MGMSFSKESISFVQNLLINNKTCLLCDNGKKIQEFIEYSNLIKEEDFIMAHDYKDDENFTHCDWQWVEIKYSDIKNSVIKNNLNKYQKINFEKVAWCCYKK